MSPRQLTSPLSKESSRKRGLENLRKAREREFVERWARKDPDVHKQYQHMLQASRTKLHVGNPKLRAAIALDNEAAKLEASQDQFAIVRAKLKYYEQNQMLLEDEASEGL